MFMTDTLQDTARTALACLDLTSLNAGDDAAAMAALCARAAGPAGPPAALCVWPRFVAQARAGAPAGVRVAGVANFPHGSSDVAAAVADARAIVAAGGDEVDLVLPWRALLGGYSTGDAAAGVDGAVTGAATGAVTGAVAAAAAGAVGAVAAVTGAALAAALVAAVRVACAGRTLKLIIESGDLADPALIRQACQIGLDAGVDFLKTSTGKTATGATPAAARVMLAAIAGHPRGAAVGFKASGGIRTGADAAVYIALVRELLGADAATPQRLRFGASGLLGDIEAVLAGQGAGNMAPVGTY